MQCCTLLCVDASSCLHAMFTLAFVFTNTCAPRYTNGTRTAAQFEAIRSKGLATASVQSGALALALSAVSASRIHRLGDNESLVPRGLYWSTPHATSLSHSKSEWKRHGHPVVGVAWHYHWTRLIDRKIPVISCVPTSISTSTANICASAQRVKRCFFLVFVCLFTHMW
jgi:hypothetical protein